MGLFNKHNNDTSTGAVGNHHHTKADAALAGAAAHHESNGHPTRNGVLAAGTVGGVQHHRNHQNDGLNHGHTHGHAGTAPLGTTAGAGYGAGHTHTGPAPLSGGVGANTSTGSAMREAESLEKKGVREGKMGNMLHSTNMKEKSAAHLAQADHLKMQASELSEAQRLEHEAGLRRQRAVGLGAHPTHASGATGHGLNSAGRY